MAETKYRSRLKVSFEETIKKQLQKEIGCKNIHEIPCLSKVVLNMGVGEAVNDRKAVENAFNEMMAIAGQKPVVTKARQSLAGFKLREGMAIGCKVTLRGNRMYDFIDRLVTIALPRARDFQGLNPKSFDGQGNFAMGIKEHIIFPEIDFDKVDRVKGMDIIICTTAKTDDEARNLLRLFNFPFPKGKTKSAKSAKPAKSKAK